MINLIEISFQIKCIETKYSHVIYLRQQTYQKDFQMIYAHVMFISDNILGKRTQFDIL